MASDAFSSTVHPFIKEYCIECHRPDKKKGQLDLTIFQSEKDMRNSIVSWEHVLLTLEDGDMPPEKAKQPSSKKRQEVIAYLQNWRKKLAEEMAGDPGQQLPFRLTKSRFQNKVRDIAGVSIDLEHLLPDDARNSAGFNNDSSAQSMTPGMLTKYLQAAKVVADHAILDRHEILFARGSKGQGSSADRVVLSRLIYTIHPMRAFILKRL